MRRIFQFLGRSQSHIREDVDTEVRFHFDARADELIRAGLTETHAWAQARREFGDLDDARRYMRQIDRRTERSTRRRNLMWDVRHDVQYALRRLAAAPRVARPSSLSPPRG